MDAKSIVGWLTLLIGLYIFADSFRKNKKITSLITNAGQGYTDAVTTLQGRGNPGGNSLNGFRVGTFTGGISIGG